MVHPSAGILENGTDPVSLNSFALTGGILPSQLSAVWQLNFHTKLATFDTVPPLDKV